MRLAALELLALLDHPSIRAIADAIVLDEAVTTPADLADDAALDRWVKATVSDYVHATGTCRMGSPDDPSAVVDSRCRFIGVEWPLLPKTSRASPRRSSPHTAAGASRDRRCRR